MKKYAFGADIGGTTVKLGLFTTEGELLEKWEITTRTGEEFDILQDVADSCRGMMEQKKTRQGGICRHRHRCARPGER